MKVPSAEPLRAIVIDADGGRRGLAETVLRTRGHSVSGFAGAPAALDALDDQVDLAVVAVSGDTANGLATLRSLRELGRPGLVVMAVTERGDTGILEEALAAGADDCVGAPLDEPTLVRRVVVAERRVAELAAKLRRNADLLRLEKAFETTQIGVTITDPDGVIVYTNPAEAAMHGWSVDELVGRSARILAPREIHGGEAPRMEGFRQWRRESLNLRRDGTTFPVRLTSDVVVDPEGRPMGLVTCCEDISEYVQAQQALEESEERYALAARGSNDGLWDWDLELDTVYFSPRWKEMLGLDEHGIGEDPELWMQRIHPEDLPRVRTAIADHLAGLTPMLESEHRIEAADGGYRWVLTRGVAVRDEAGKPHRMAGSQTDINDRKLLDGLTDLPNRILFMDRLAQAHERSRRRDDYRYAVLSLDLDRFKNVNYSFGHTYGDKLLTAVAARLRVGLRASDTLTRGGATVAHLGGDEFTVLLDHLGDPADAIRVAKRFLEELQVPFEIDGHEIFTSASIGIAMGARTYTSPEDVLRDADTAMSRAKAMGKGCYVVFDEDMHARAVAALRLENELRRALQREELSVFYQPIVSLESGLLAGFEALVRWQHPDEGLLAPERFIHLAEETGLILPLDRWVIRRVCQQIRAWQLEYGKDLRLFLSVNLSGAQFTKPDLIVDIDRSLRSYGLLGSALKLEITESVIMEHARYASEMLSQLRSLDIKLSIDDFGTGYSSLSYLRRFEIDTLKIDRSFVSRMDQSEESAEIVRTIVTLAKNLGKDVVAEGIEKRAQLDALRELGCKYGQGYFFAAPLPVDKASKLVEERASSQLFKV